MSQISPPMRILLAGSVLFMAVWFAVLRPGGAETTEPAAPAPAPVTSGAAPQSAPGAVVAGAQAAADAAGQAATARAGEAGAATATAPGTTSGTATTPAQPGQAAVAKPDFKAAGVPAPIAEELGEKVMVMLFWNPKAADDRAVNREVKKVYRHRGDVAVHRVPIEDVSKYAAVTRGADVNQSPTVLVVDRKLSVEALVGYVDTTSIDQAVVDAFLNDGRQVDTVAYLQKLEGYCTGANRRIEGLDDITSPARFRRAVAQITPAFNRLAARVKSLKPPAQYRGMHRDLTALIRTDQSILRSVGTFARGGSVNSAAVGRQIRRHDTMSYALDLQMAAAGLTACR